MKRVLLALLPVLVAMVPSSAGAVDTVGVSLGCSEPAASFDTNTDLDTATGLANAVNAMTLNPAGLTCGLTQGAPSLSSGASKAFAVGGGQQPGNCADSSTVHFGFSAHAVDDPTNPEAAKGSISIGTSGAGPCIPSHLKADVTCLVVTPATATTQAMAVLAGPVKDSFGVFANSTWVIVAVQDNDPEANQTNPDEFNFDPEEPQAAGCEQTVFPQPIEHGNIEIHPNTL